ncbi:MAG: MerR family transcriptional regulator [Rikenellaceae bacterium]|nr:MerR family transcriptional regulator [Rikenellaceae bacterium]
MKSADNQSEKLYYTMGEVSEMLDVSQSLLRFWEKEFDEIRPRRNKKGNRLFTAQDVKTLKKIYHLVKEKGLKIAAAKRQLKLGDTYELSREALIVEKLQAIRAILIEVKQSLDAESEIEVDVESAVGELEEILPVVQAIKEDIQPQSMVEVEQHETASNEEVETVAESEDNAKEDNEDKKAEKPKTPRKPRAKRPKFAFKEVELFSLDELDAMQPKPGERRGNDEVQQTLF